MMMDDKNTIFRPFRVHLGTHLAIVDYRLLSTHLGGIFVVRSLGVCVYA